MSENSRRARSSPITVVAGPATWCLNRRGGVPLSISLGSTPSTGQQRGRGWLSVVVVIGAICLVLKLWIAASTFGTDDVRYWSQFLGGVEEHGPIGIYGTEGYEAPYNHPPLAGWMLLGMAKLADLGLSVPFLVRVPAILADLGTALMIFLLLRHGHSDRAAAVTACLFSISPVLFVISGFHGNTDPVFVLLVLVASHALVLRSNGFVAGVSIALAVSVKLTPVVMLPLLLVLAVRRGRRVWVRFLAGGAVVVTVLWLPALALRGPEMFSQVLGYAGVGPRQWGLSGIALALGVPGKVVFGLGDLMRFFVVAFSALVPLALLRTARSDQVALLGLPLSVFLLLTPTFGYQYLAWALAPAFLLAPWALANLYSLAAGLTAVLVYSSWSDAPPWQWDEARSTPTPDQYLPLLSLTWAVLALVCLSGARRATSSSPPVGSRAHANVQNRTEAGNVND